MFITFCRGRIPLDDGLASQRITRAAEACRAIAARDPAYGRITTDDVHAAIGAEATRRVAPLIEFMCDVGVLEWDRARLKVLVENDRVDSILMAHQDSPHASLLRQYRDDLAARGRKPVTQQNALTAAVALLAALGDKPLAELSQRHLARALRKTPGQRASLKGFLSFVAGQGGPKLTLPALHPTDPVAQERQLREEIKAWRQRLRKPRHTDEAKALLALLIARIHALPIPRVLSLRDNDVTVTYTSVTLWPEADAITLEESLVGAFRRWAEWSVGYASPPNPWCFKGRYSYEALSEAAVAYYRKPDTKGKPPKY